MIDFINRVWALLNGSCAEPAEPCSHHVGLEPVSVLGLFAQFAVCVDGLLIVLYATERMGWGREESDKLALHQREQ